MNDRTTPIEVNRAVSLAYGLLVIGSLLALLQVPFDPRLTKISAAFPILLVMLLLGGGISWFLITKIKNRRNWARITWLVLLCISVPGMIKNLMEGFKFVPFFGLTSTLLFTGKIYCMYLLFGASANRWFSERPQDEETSSSLLEEEARFRAAGIYEKEKSENR